VCGADDNQVKLRRALAIPHIFADGVELVAAQQVCALLSTRTS
jgi:hypothetical protein